MNNGYTLIDFKPKKNCIKMDNDVIIMYSIYCLAISLCCARFWNCKDKAEVTCMLEKR